MPRFYQEFLQPLAARRRRFGQTLTRRVPGREAEESKEVRDEDLNGGFDVHHVGREEESLGRDGTARAAKTISKKDNIYGRNLTGGLNGSEGSGSGSVLVGGVGVSSVEVDGFTTGTGCSSLCSCTTPAWLMGLDGGV